MGPRLEGELLEPQRLCSGRTTIRFAAIDELCRPAKPRRLDLVRAGQGIRRGTQPIGEALEASEKGPRSPW